ncbi:hypothetical protein ACJX0J_023376, partial [Zea mays]
LPQDIIVSGDGRYKASIDSLAFASSWDAYKILELPLFCFWDGGGARYTVYIHSPDMNIFSIYNNMMGTPRPYTGLNGLFQFQWLANVCIFWGLSPMCHKEICVDRDRRVCVVLVLLFLDGQIIKRATTFINIFYTNLSTSVFTWHDIHIL